MRRSDHGDKKERMDWILASRDQSLDWDWVTNKETAMYS